MEKATVLRAILSPEARQRLANMRLVKPQLVERVEEYLIQVAQTGKLEIPVSDGQLKGLLARLVPKRKRTRIERR